MGIYTRDYFRWGSGRGEQIPPVCKDLIIATVAVFLVQIFITRPPTPQEVRAIVEQYREPLPAKKRPEKKPEKKPSGEQETAPPHGTERPAAADSTAAASPKKEPPGGSAASAGKPASDGKAGPEREAQPGKKQTVPEEGIEEEPDENDMAAARELLPSVSIVQEWFELDANKVVRKGQVWRLLTCAFCHDRFGVWHILFNMLFLYYFGRMLEPLYGSREFLLFYLTAAVVSSLCYIGLCLFTHDSTPAIGASGAVMAVVVLYAILHPREKIYVFMLLPIEIRWLVLIYVIYDLHPVLLALAGTPINTGVANAAHLGGAAFGFLYWRCGLHLEDSWDRLARFGRLLRLRLTRNVRLHRAPDESDSDESRPDRRNAGRSTSDELDALVDKILEKVHKHGRDSLTQRERAVLKAAAESYREKGKP